MNKLELNEYYKFHKEIKNLALGGRHTCASTISMLICWGRNNNGEIDVPDELKEGGLSMLVSS